MRNRVGRKFAALMLLAALAVLLAAPCAAAAPSEVLPLAQDGGLTLPLPASAAAEVILPRSTLDSAELMRSAPVMTAPQNTGRHIGYIDGTDGMFCPDQVVTRADLAQHLSDIVTDIPKGVSYFYDVPWNLCTVQKVVSLGLMTAPNGFFRPNDPATRADCAYALAMLLPYDATDRQSFPDVPETHWAYDAITRGGAYGLFTGLFTENENEVEVENEVEDEVEVENFNPENPVTRAELVSMLNRALGMSIDQKFASALPVFQFYEDVPADHWAYWDIVEATVQHTCRTDAEGGETWLWADLDFLSAEGPVRINGRLYWIRDGKFVCGESIGYLYFDTNGRYTTGNTYVDTRVNNIIEQLTNNGMTRDQKLRVLFNYCRDYYTYLKRPLISKGQTGWEPDYAAFFLSYGKGNCYCFSAAYCLMCRNLGLQAYTVVGRALNSPHGWVEINLDGTTYLFDTQLEWRYLHDWGMRGYNFFKQPIYNTTVAYSR